MTHPVAKLVLASHNTKKLAELQAILEPVGVELLGLREFQGAPIPEETGDTFEENARIKALSAAAYTLLPAVADDSGLVVDILDGAPGVRSARFAGEDADDAENNALLLEKLGGLEPEKRKAGFISVVALAFPDGNVRTFRGETRGRILEAPMGGGGFGYDPLFLSDELGVSFAEADPEAKNRVSHRGKALAGLIGYLETLG